MKCRMLVSMLVVVCMLFVASYGSAIATSRAPACQDDLSHKYLIDRIRELPAFNGVSQIIGGNIQACDLRYYDNFEPYQGNILVKLPDTMGLPGAMLSIPFFITYKGFVYIPISSSAQEIIKLIPEVMRNNMVREVYQYLKKVNFEIDSNGMVLIGEDFNSQYGTFVMYDPTQKIIVYAKIHFYSKYRGENERLNLIRKILGRNVFGSEAISKTLGLSFIRTNVRDEWWYYGMDVDYNRGYSGYVRSDGLFVDSTSGGFWDRLRHIQNAPTTVQKDKHFKIGEVSAGSSHPFINQFIGGLQRILFILYYLYSYLSASIGSFFAALRAG